MILSDEWKEGRGEERRDVYVVGVGAEEVVCVGGSIVDHIIRN